MTENTKTDKIEITDWDDFQNGDVVENIPGPHEIRFLVRREVPVKPTPEPGTFGTAVVDGFRIHGVIDDDREFCYLVLTDGYSDDQYTEDFKDFVPDGEEILPTREELMKAIQGTNATKAGGCCVEIHPDRAADRVLELLEGRK